MPAAITQLPDGGRSRRRGQARQPARDGAKRSGLTGPRTAGQSVGVMAAACGHQALSASIQETNETRRLGVRQEVTVRRPSQAWIQCECAFTYMNAVSGENLSGVFLPMKST